MSRRAAPLAALALALACASSKGPSDVPHPTGRVTVTTAAGASHVVRVEVARTDAQRAKGLMDRDALAPDAGMLFIFDESAPHGFWMKNTRIPLDMLFLDDGGRIVGIVARAAPMTLELRDPGVPSRYVLEVNGGWAAAHGVAVGDRASFENVLF